MVQETAAKLNDTLEGADGQDRLDGGGGMDVLIGYRIGYWSSDYLDGDDGAEHIGVTVGPQALVRDRGIRAARQQSVLDLIARRASDPSFDPAQAAERLGMSVRYLHRLLEPSGRTFSEHLIERRLRRALDMLRDQGCAHLKIGSVARNVGFSDISHFNRSFRRAFGDTPYGVRVRAAREVSAAAPAKVGTQ